jgi:hypothetical protein
MSKVSTSSSRGNEPRRSEPVSTENTSRSEEGWYGPEALNELQQLYDALWVKLQKDVSPREVDTAREMLAILLFELHGAMTHPGSRRAAIRIIGWAYDEALQQLSAKSQNRPNMHVNLACCIARFRDEGESDPLQLSRMAVAVNTFSGSAPVGDRATSFDTIRGPINTEWPIAF